MRALLVINATLDPAREREIAAGLYPRKDYLELRAALGADILDLTALDRRYWTRLVRRVAGAAVAQALLAWTMSRRYDAVFADRETTGFVLAALYKLPFFRGRLSSRHGDAPAFAKEASLFAPPAPSGGAWGDASPQPPAIHSSRVARGLDMGDALSPSALTAPLPHPGSSFMAGVWGETSPQAPPEGVGGARGEAQAPPEGTEGEGGPPLPRTRRGAGSEGRPRLTMIGHLLSPPGKQALVRGLRLDRVIDAVVVHSTLQARLAERTLGLLPDQVALVPYQTDERFWAPRDEDGGGDGDAPARICSAGLEYRDYETLVEAVRGLPVELVIAAASHWSTHQGLAGERPTPPNVRVDSFDYAALRDLYASSLFVVVPLHDVENQAGITTILEAMAMGKAVVVSHTRGQTDVVRDRRHASRSDASRPTQPDWARDLGAPEETARAHTGVYVRPGDPDELRRAITFLLEHPDQARAMGANGRRLVAQTMGLDHFTARLAAIIRGDAPAAREA